jgi:hypothetical protein
MKYAGHTKEKTTLRYLNWGRLAQATHTAMATAGVALHPQSLEHALRWIKNSTVYKTIQEHLDTIERLPRNCMQER